MDGQLLPPSSSPSPASTSTSQQHHHHQTHGFTTNAFLAKGVIQPVPVTPLLLSLRHWRVAAVFIFCYYVFNFIAFVVVNMATYGGFTGLIILLPLVGKSVVKVFAIMGVGDGRFCSGVVDGMVWSIYIIIIIIIIIAFLMRKKKKKGYEYFFLPKFQIN
jgi:hypothetical protein